MTEQDQEMDQNREREQALRQQGWFEQPDVGPFVELVGPLWRRESDQGVEYGLNVQKKHLNSIGIVHGGLLMTLLDQVISHVIWDVGDRTPMATIDMDTHFIDAVRQGDWIIASAKVQRRTRSLVFVEGQLNVGQRLVLSGQAIMKLRTN